jgi:phage repressor protein C with HTH and peptisase S24 domain
MEKNLHKPGKRLKSIRNDMKFTQEEFAKRLGMAGFQIRDIESGKVELSMPLAKLLHYEFLISEKYLFEGTEPAIDVEAARSIDIKPEMIVDAEEDVEYGAFVFIPRVTGEISAGGGLLPDNTIEIKVAFRQDWIQRKGDPSKMSIIRVQGDSMEPTFMSGDIVLMDHSRNHIDPWGGIYAMVVDSKIMIKRLQVMTHLNKIRLISDNLKYETYEIDPDQVIINGKVIWFGREIER